MDVQVIRLRVKSALHSGRPGVGAEETDPSIGADSIFGALVSQLALRDAALIEPLTHAFPRRIGDAFEPGSPPFLLTSAFPFAGEVLFFPIPMIPINNASDQGSSEVSANKSLKKVRYVSQTLFEQLLSGASLTKLDSSTVRLQNGQVWLTAGEQKLLPESLQHSGMLWQTERHPHVSIDRATNRSNIFFHGETFYQEGCGIWFGLMIHDPTFTLGGLPIASMLRILLCDLETYGLGQLRNYGLGEVQRVDSDPLPTIRLPDPTLNGVVTLSRVAPTPDDLSRLTATATNYKLLQVGGRMSSRGFTATQRNNVPMFAEGSVIGAAAGENNAMLGGCLVDASPVYSAHPAWRYGLIFPIGIGKG